MNKKNAKRCGLVVAILLTFAAVAATQEEEEDSFALSTRIFVIEGSLAGTGFRVCQPDVVLTADHVVGDMEPNQIRIIRRDTSQSFTPTRIERHPSADVAGLFLRGTDTADLECFNIGTPIRPGLLGTDVQSYGFPSTLQPFRRRLAKGHIQARYRLGPPLIPNYQYDAFELTFPAFGGMSGSPVFLDEDWSQERFSVLAVLTRSYPAFDEKAESRADWAIGLAIAPLQEWLDGLANPAH